MRPRGLRSSWRKVTNTYATEVGQPSRHQEGRDALRTELLDADDERVWRLFFSNMLRMNPSPLARKAMQSALQDLGIDQTVEEFVSVQHPTEEQPTTE